MNIVGVDIGGTSIKLGLFDAQGNERQSFAYETENKKSGTYIVDQLIHHIQQFDSIDAIGVCSAGQIDRTHGMIRQCANIPHLSGVYLKKQLESQFHVPVTLENDVNAAALGEDRFGVGKDHENFLFLTFGTGVGGAMVHHSELYYGRDGYAAEFGHMITHGNGNKCNCGRNGCYETYASTTALIQKAQQLDAAYTNGKAIFKAYHQGDEAIATVIDSWIEEIMIGLISLVHIFNPPVIIIGGGIMEQEEIIERIAQHINSEIIESFRDVKIMKASLGNKAGMLGAITPHLR